jgi:hypothetical protein
LKYERNVRKGVGISKRKLSGGKSLLRQRQRQMKDRNRGEGRSGKAGKEKEVTKKPALFQDKNAPESTLAS